MAPGVDPILAETMQRDPNPGVRAHAIFAASFRDLTHLRRPLGTSGAECGLDRGEGCGVAEAAEGQDGRVIPFTCSAAARKVGHVGADADRTW